MYESCGAIRLNVNDWCTFHKRDGRFLKRIIDSTSKSNLETKLTTAVGGMTFFATVFTLYENIIGKNG